LRIIKQLVKENPEALLMEPREDFDQAVVSITTNQEGQVVAVYDEVKIIDVLVDQGMTEDEAWEYFYFNIEGAYMGKNTPVYKKAAPPER
tara:strand:+ start:434 stop:703 length:270 start_codon:yes stop_codon:yes gene_type:complete